MSFPTCTAASLINPCFNLSVLNDHLRKQLQIWAMVNELAVIGGGNYTQTLSTTLLTDAAAVFQTMNKNERQVAETSILINNSGQAGAPLTTAINTLMQQIAPLNNATMDQLEQIRLLLLCKLGTHKTYPQ